MENGRTELTNANARAAANVLVGAAAVAAAYAIVRTPSLRRVAWQLARLAITTTIPAYLGREVTHAWQASGERPRRTTALRVVR